MCNTSYNTYNTMQVVYAKMMIMVVVMATVMLSAPIIPSSSAQGGPEGRPPLSSYASGRTEEELLQSCCAAVKYAAKGCICAMLQTPPDEDTTVTAEMKSFFSFCRISATTVNSLCSPVLDSVVLHPRVIIVGAGMSGINAAKVLHDSGIRDFLILEASNRIGGRIYKTEFGGYTVEKGANWLHGVGGPLKNPMFEIAEAIKLKNYYSDFSNVSLNTYKQEGGLYSKEEVDVAFDMAVSNEEFGTHLAEILDANKYEDDDMSILAAERLNHMEPKTLLERMVDYFSFDGEQAEAPRITSLKHVLPRPEFILYGESEYFVADERGFESIVHEIGKTYLSYKDGRVTDPRVMYNQVVTSIEHSLSGVTIRTEDGKVYQAKTAILSPSVGVLQSDLITFKPQLPLWKRRAISEFSLGIYTKIFLKFPKKFWPTGPGTEFFFYVHQRRGYYAIWQQLENEYPGANIMFVTVADQESIRVEQQSDQKTKAETMEVLRKMFGNDIPNATDIMIPRWNSDRFYKGSFSNWPAGYTQKKHNNLRAPVGNLYFTGEHTHPLLFGYADGAYFAGAETARDVINFLRLHPYNGEYTV